MKPFYAMNVFINIFYMKPFFFFSFLKAAQYIGEICRYLLSAPETPEEKKHSIQLMFGNGLRPQIWDLFVQRFNIPRIGEFYGATEGNSSVGEFHFHH